MLKENKKSEPSRIRSGYNDHVWWGTLRFQLCLVQTDGASRKKYSIQRTQISLLNPIWDQNISNGNDFCINGLFYNNTMYVILGGQGGHFTQLLIQIRIETGKQCYLCILFVIVLIRLRKEQRNPFSEYMSLNLSGPHLCNSEDIKMRAFS